MASIFEGQPVNPSKRGRNSNQNKGPHLGSMRILWMQSEANLDLFNGLTGKAFWEKLLGLTACRCLSWLGGCPFFSTFCPPWRWTQIHFSTGMQDEICQVRRYIFLIDFCGFHVYTSPDAIGSMYGIFASIWLWKNSRFRPVVYTIPRW